MNGGWANLIGATVSSVLGTASAVQGIKNNTKNIMSQIDANTKSFLYEADIIADQRLEADRELSDIMSYNGLEALKAEATIRAQNASRGVSGNSTEAIRQSVAMQNNLVNSQALSEWRNTDINLLRRLGQRKLEFNNQNSVAMSGMTSPTSALLKTLLYSIAGVSDLTIQKFDNDFMANQNALADQVINPISNQITNTNQQSGWDIYNEMKRRELYNLLGG